MDSLVHEYYPANGIRLHVVQAGLESGPAVILLHGFPEFWRGWARQIEPLAQAGLRVFVPDQRGYNLSDKPPGVESYHLEETTRDIVGLIDALGLEKASLVGHDWGGLVAWWLAIRYPQRVERLAILNAPHPAAYPQALLRDPTQLFRSLYALFYQLPRLPEAILRNNDWEVLVQALHRTSRPGTFSQADIEHYRRAWWQGDAMTAMLNWYRANFRRPPDFPPDARVHVPTLILWGARDFALSRSNAHLSAGLCESARLVLFEGATHWLQHEQAGRVNQLLVNFFYS